MFSKWLITDSCAAQPASTGGRPICTTGDPRSTSTRQIVAPMMKAVIWLRVIDDAQIPIAIICADRSAAPRYCASMIPGSASDAIRTPSAIGSVPATVIITKSQLPANLPSTISVSVSGWARSHSSVRPRRSSARLFIATAGTKTTSSQGRRSKKGLSVAYDIAKRERKARYCPSPRNAMAST